MTVKRTYKIIAITFLTIGLLLFLVGAGFLLEDTIAKSRMEKTMAEITGYAGGGMQVSYQYRGAVFEGRLNYTSSSKRAGDTVTIYVDPQQPTEFRDFTSILIGIILSSVGFMLTIPGIIFGISLRRRKRLKDRLLFEGTRVEAQIVSTGMVYHVRVNNRYPYLIEARWHDKDTGEYHHFKSPYLTYDPAPLLAEREIATVPVYLDRGNYKKYHMALEECREGLE